MYYNNQGGGNHRQGQGQHHGGNPFNFMGQNSDFFQGFQNFQQNFGNAFGNQPNGMGQTVHYNQHHSQANGGSRSQNRVDNSIDISNHSVSMTLMEPSESVILRGHNCKIEIGPGNTISNLLITGHNNRIFSKNSGSGNQIGVVDTIDVMGHNNRIESIIANNLKVGGHNNRFQNIQCSIMDDTGICNQFNHCQQLQHPQRQQARQQHRQAPPQGRQNPGYQQYQQPQDVNARNEDIEDEVDDENAYDSEDEEGEDVEDYSDEAQQEQTTGITTGMNRQDEESSNDPDEINEEELIRQANGEDQDGVYSTNFNSRGDPRIAQNQSEQEDSDREDIDEQIQQEEGLLGEDEIEEIDTQFEMMNQAFNQQQARPSIRQHQQAQNRQSTNQTRVNNVQQQNRNPGRAPTNQQAHSNQRRTHRMPNGQNSHQSYTFSNVSGANPNDPNVAQFTNGMPGVPNNFGQQQQRSQPSQQSMPPNIGPQAQPGMQGNQPNNLFNLSGIMNDVQHMLNNIQTQQPGIQINFNGNYYQQPNQRQGAQQQNYQYQSNSGQQNFVYDAHNHMPQNQHEYYEEYGEEDGEAQVDEDGQPLPSPEEIKNIINAIPSFKYEEKKQGSKTKGDDLVSDTESVKANNKDSCAICLDELQTGQMVKALACSHKFHSKCINFWLKQKLKCPLCKERINLNNYV